MGAFIAIAVLILLTVITYPMMRELDGKDKFINFSKPSLYDLVGYLQLGVGFIAVLMLLAAAGIFGYDFYGYVRIATSIVAIILIYLLLRYQFRTSLLLIGLVATLVLFNPIERIVMSRSEWIIVDLLVAILLPVFAYVFTARQKGLYKHPKSYKK